MLVDFHYHWKTTLIVGIRTRWWYAQRINLWCTLKYLSGGSVKFSLGLIKDREETSTNKDEEID